MAIVILGGAALLTDVAWWWTNEQRMQRAADAAALAGAVYLPADQNRAFTAARNEATKNGYTGGVGGVVVVPRRDPNNERKLIVDIDGPVQTNFARVFCWQGGPCLTNVPVGVTGAAEFVLPVPMGSPENYYGVFGMVRNATSSSQQPVLGAPQRGGNCGTGTWTAGSSTVCRPTSQSISGSWQTTSTGSGNNINNAASSNNNVYMRTDADGNGDQHVFGGFGAQTGVPTPATGEVLTIVGLQVRLTDAFINSQCNGSNNARINVALSWNGGTDWTGTIQAPASGTLGTNTDNGDYVVGGNSDLTAWGAGPPGGWTRNHLSDANFRVRLTATENCNNDKQFSVDMLDVRAIWDYRQVTMQLVTTTLPDALLRGPNPSAPCPNVTWTNRCFEPTGPNLNARGFWATLNTQGAENINGDAYQPGYDTRTSGISPACPQNNRACYDGYNYYNYAIEMPPNATSGRVYIFDPQFCAVDVDSGTGDRWFGGNAAVTTQYALYDTKASLYDLLEDEPPLATTRTGGLNLFKSMAWRDSTMGGGNGTECMRRTDAQYGDERDFHNRWFLLYDSMTGGPEGTVYRVHTSSTDRDNTTQQLGTNGANSFAIFVSATVPSGSPSPRVYGLGAMQAFTPLSANSAIDTNPADDVISEFYLAQIEAAHAGKTIEIRLWDPGDTAALRAELQILKPIDNGAATATNTGWEVSTFSYTSAQGTTNSGRASCNTLTGTNVTSVLTNNGGGSDGRFNGCWLVMRAQVPDSYEANEDGWWKIRYRMDGNDTSNDVTTWQVNLIGNPVHLVPE